MVLASTEFGYPNSLVRGFAPLKPHWEKEWIEISMCSLGGMNMEWINANDRLPEVECGCVVSVLAISNSGEMLVLYYDGKCWFGADGKVRDSKFKITHWMPLPKKPKGTSMERITSNRPWAEAQKNLSNEKGYSHIWTRLNAIENILGEDYDLNRLRELVMADKDGRCVVLPCNAGTVLPHEGTNYEADHWNILLSAFADDPSTKSGHRLKLFSVEEAAEAALKGGAYGG